MPLGLLGRVIARNTGAHVLLHASERRRVSAQDACWGRRAYELLKRGLATRDWAEINFYADAKGPLIEAILAHAQT